jgi:hypothetical protein
MSEERDDQGKWVWAFVLGLIVGVLLMLGVGGGLTMVQLGRARIAAEEAAMEAERARMVEMEAREHAERAVQEAAKAIKEREAVRAKAEAAKAEKK